MMAHDENGLTTTKIVDIGLGLNISIAALIIKRSSTPYFKTQDMPLRVMNLQGPVN